MLRQLFKDLFPQAQNRKGAMEKRTPSCL